MTCLGIWDKASEMNCTLGCSAVQFCLYSSPGVVERPPASAAEGFPQIPSCGREDPADHGCGWLRNFPELWAKSAVGEEAEPA